MNGLIMNPTTDSLNIDMYVDANFTGMQGMRNTQKFYECMQ
jgi:hypothetical protein